MIDQRAPHWYAFVTRPRHEKRVDEYLQAAGITSFLPLRRTLNQWKDRKKWVEAPLFSCYIFSFIPFVNKLDILKCPSVVRIVTINNQPVPVRSEEIEAIKTFLHAKSEMHVLDGPVPGESVRIKTGPLAGLEGKFMEQKGAKWFVIYVEAVGKSVLVDVNENLIDRIDRVV